MSTPAPTGTAPPGGYLQRWRQLRPVAWLYLAHAALLTGSLAMATLVFNLAIVALDFPPFEVLGQELTLLGVLGSLSVAVAGLTSLPLLWLINRIGFWWALVGNALLQAASMFIFALLPLPLPLMLAAALTGMGGVLFQVSSVPFMIRLSNEATRDHLFSANFAVNFGVSGLGRLLAGSLAVWFAQRFALAAGDVLTYRAIFAVAGAGLLLSLVPLLLIYRRSQQPQPPPAEQPPPTPDAAEKPAARRDMIARLPLLRALPEPWAGLLREPWPLLRLMLSPLLISCGAALLIPYLNLFFKARYAVADDTLGLIFAALDVTIGLAALAGPFLSIRIGKMPTIVLAQALSLPFLLSLGFVPLLGVAVGAALARAALFNMISPLYDAFAMERTEEALRPTVIGSINGAFAAAYVVMPLISTRVQQDYGFAPLFVATAVCYALATLANYWLFLHPRA